MLSDKYGEIYKQMYVHFGHNHTYQLTGYLQKNKHMEKEIWKDIEGYSRYMISNLGRVKTKERFSPRLRTKDYHVKEHIHNPPVSNKGYRTVILSEKSKQKRFLVHRLVAISFVKGRCEDKDHVNHIDGNKLNNHYGNLEWCDHAWNMKHSYLFLGRIAPQKGRYGNKSSKHYAVNQFTLEGKFIRKWDCMMDVEREIGIKGGYVSRAARNGTTAGNYKWTKV